MQNNVGKSIEEIHQNKLSVDQWSVDYEKEKCSEETHLRESYIGKVDMEQCDEQKYLGFTISNADNNMANIKSVRNKSYGAIKAIFSKLKDLKLRKYHFECGMIFLNIMLRSSILYGSETYYNSKENELRALERIEENYMRQLLGSTREITEMTTKSYEAMIRIECNELAFQYLLNKKRTKGKEINT